MTDQDENSTLCFHGAGQTVTGSCMELSVGGKRLLVDCGMFQGSRTLEQLNVDQFAFRPSDIDAVLLTHAHIDHSGLLPKLVRHGFVGPIYCTRPTRDLLKYMLADAAHVQESDTKRRNRRRDRAGEPPFEPIYTADDARQAWRQCKVIGLDHWFNPATGVRARLWNAGHVLGAASIEVEAGGMRLCFSGDLGPHEKAFHPDPSGPTELDHLVCESTYGGRARSKMTMVQRRKLLGEEVRSALAKGGNLIIPVFALERTQELLLDLARLIEADQLGSAQVFVDSPLANRITSVFAAHAADLEDTGGRDIFDRPEFRFVEKTTESMRLNSMSGVVILAGSGMCEGGRIRHHLVHNLYRRDSTVLFVGYQAQGTLGRVILDGAKSVRISGQEVHVRATIHRIDQYSAHADHGELLDWIGDRMPVGGTLFLDHGEPNAIEALRAAAAERFPTLDIQCPMVGSAFRLAPAATACRLVAGRAECSDLVGPDWQNDYAAFSASLRQRLLAIDDPVRRKQVIDEMSKLLDAKGQRSAALG